MTGRDEAAVGHRKQESFTPIKSSVQAYGKPQIAGPAQRQAHKHCEYEHTHRAGFVFARVTQVPGSE
jgi:hypothetical protein